MEKESLKLLSPIKSIRKYCLGCGNGSPKEVKLCPISECELFQYRLGKNPNRRGLGNPRFKRTAVELDKK